MQEIKGLVSIIIPAYNAAEFLPDTLDSVRLQSHTKWEVIVVDDGSKDSTVDILQSEKDERITLIRQQNSGVSTARNTGLREAKGEYIIFLDSDDLLTESFIEIRLAVLQSDSSLGFVGGLIESFPRKSILKKAAGENAEKEILFFDSSYVTAPSNYLFRKSVLIKNNICFNSNLSSTADRFFILQLSKYTKGKSIPGENGKLLYRVSHNSMSNRLTPGLILDNEQFYKELERSNLLPEKKRGRFKGRYFYSLAVGFMKIKYIKISIYYLIKSFFCSPFYLVKMAAKNIIFALKD